MMKRMKSQKIKLIYICFGVMVVYFVKRKNHFFKKFQINMEDIIIFIPMKFGLMNSLATKLG